MGVTEAVEAPLTDPFRFCHTSPECAPVAPSTLLHELLEDQNLMSLGPFQMYVYSNNAFQEGGGCGPEIRRWESTAEMGSWSRRVLNVLACIRRLAKVVYDVRVLK